MASNAAAVPATGATTIVTQTRILPEHASDFAAWQEGVNNVIAGFPGFVSGHVMPPSPPLQPDWVIVQRFVTTPAAQAWLSSPERQKLLETARPWLVGNDDIHLFEESSDTSDSAVSIVVSTRVAADKVAAFRAWNQRINAAQAHYPGFQGYKIVPPIPNVQEDWVTVLQFDNEDHLNAWLNSPDRARLLQEGAGIFSESHTRTVRSAFGQWFPLLGAAGSAPVWKQNMLVLLGLYPVVFLFGFFVQAPFLMKQFGLPFWLALFIGNVVGVLLLNYLVPWISGRFAWWLQPAGEGTSRQNLIGVAVLLACYALLMLIFSRFPPAL